MCVQCILVKSFPKLDLDSFATGLIRGGIKVVAVLGGGVKFYLRKRAFDCRCLFKLYSAHVALKWLVIDCGPNLKLN